MILKRNKNYTIQLILIINFVIALLLTIFFTFEEGKTSFVNYFIIDYVFSNSIGFSIVFSIIFVNKITRKGIFRYVLTFIAFLISVVFGSYLGSFINGLLFDFVDFQSVKFGLIFFNLIIGLIFTLLGFSIYSLINKIQVQKINAIKEKQLRAEAQLMSLKSKINPHFLFNTLNSISSLIDSEPQKANLLVERFSDLLRFTLDKFKNKKISLKEEIHVIRTYLEIEKVRLGERLKYKINYSNDSGNILVPGAILLNLVENSVKHGIAKRIEGGEIEIVIEEMDKKIRFEVRNSGEFNMKESKKGFGTEYISEILKTLYQDGASVELNDGNGFSAVIVLPKE